MCLVLPFYHALFATLFAIPSSVFHYVMTSDLLHCYVICNGVALLGATWCNHYTVEAEPACAGDSARKTTI